MADLADGYSVAEIENEFRDLRKVVPQVLVRQITDDGIGEPMAVRPGAFGVGTCH